MATLFQDSFESADISAWSTSFGASYLSVTPSANMAGTYGLAVSNPPTEEAYVEYDIESAHGEIFHTRMGFRFDPNGITTIPVGRDYTQIYFQVDADIGIKYSSGQYYIFAHAFDFVGEHRTTEVPISDGPHTIELEWEAPATEESADGWMTFWVDGIEIETITGLNDRYKVSYIDLGFTWDALGNFSGTMYFDDFTINDDGSQIFAPPPNVPPSADAGPDQTDLVDTDETDFEDVDLDGSGSSDSDGTIVSYSWTEDAVEIATGVTPTVSLGVGEHTITLTVTDNDGDTDTDTVTIVISAPPPPPPVPLVGNPGEGPSDPGENIPRDYLSIITSIGYTYLFRAIAFKPKYSQAMTVDKTANGMLDKTHGNIYTSFQYVLRVPHVAPEPGFGTYQHLVDLVSLNNPHGYPSSTFQLIDHWGITHPMCIFYGEAAPEPITTIIDGEFAWFIVPIEIAFSDFEIEGTSFFSSDESMYIPLIF